MKGRASSYRFAAMRGYRSNRSSMRPVKRPPMEVHHRYDVEVGTVDAVNDRIRESVEIELPVSVPDRVPASRLSHDAAQRLLKFLKKIVSQTGLPFLIPQRRSFELFVSFRMADDAHEACSGYPEQLAPLGGN